MQTLKEHGIHIPEDIAIVGFNNDPVSKVIEPNLTTINYPGYEMGEVAAYLNKNEKFFDTPPISSGQLGRLLLRQRL